MHYGNGFELLIAVVFAMSPQLGGLVTKAKDLVIYFRPGGVEPLQYFLFRALAIRSELVLMIY